MSNRFFLNRFLVAGSLLLAASCSSDPKNKNHGPIVLGDSATIVTEMDPVHLQDMVQDLRPANETDAAPEATAAVTQNDTIKKGNARTAETPKEETPPPAGKGLNIPFKEITVFIPDIITKTYGKQNLQKSGGATYELTGGNIAGNQLRFSNGTIQKVTQRYQTVVGLQDGSIKLPLESLGMYASQWQPLKGSNNSFTITGLEPNKLEYNEARPAAIRNAVQQATRKARMSRDEAADWLDLAKKMRSPETLPGVVLLRSVSWRIEGKDAAGKAFNKEIRMDLPR